MTAPPGIHHVTAIGSDAQRNVDFHTGVLGLRLVKKTVNFDDPRSYHLYYGDELGRPGTIMTYFIWPGAPRGRQGTSQVTATAFSVPAGSLGYWAERLEANDVQAQEPVERLGDRVLSLEDPDGMRLELVAPSAPDPRTPWEGGGVPTEHAIRGFHSVTLSLIGYEETARLLTGTLGFRTAAADAGRFRFEALGREPGRIVDLLSLPDAPGGLTAAGTVHHVAWRTPDDQSQLVWRQDLIGAGFDVTPVLDRSYFHSIYFREPGGVLFEIATDQPGFAVDEAPERLGTSLRLPARLEPIRSQLDHLLPSIRIPGSVG